MAVGALPSCGVNIDNSSIFAGYLCIFNNSGPRQAIGFFDPARELGPCSGKEFLDILKYCADKTGVEFEIGTKKKKPAASNGKIVETYDYCDSSGALVYQICRTTPKSYRQRRPNPDKPKSWIWNMDGITAVPYFTRNIKHGPKGTEINLLGLRECERLIFSVHKRGRSWLAEFRNFSVTS